MNFNTWFDALQTRTAKNSGAGLVAFKALLERLGSPQRRYKIIHVAGTNGKGTVCTLLAHVLACAGEKTGLFISPHLISPTERIQINGTEITTDDFQRIVEKVLSCAQEPLNLFEVLTAAAFMYFAEQNVQFVVLETGLGGRKDPTNVCVPVLSIITSIGLDHTHLLGATLEQIAAEKAGIIKPGIPVLGGGIPPVAKQVITTIAQEKKAKLTWVSAGELPGQAYEQNVHLVSCAAETLGIDEGVLRSALKTVKLPGRFEVFHRGGKTIILDGAHNPQAIENLLAFWRHTPFAAQPAAVLCGFMQDKDYPRMMASLSAYFKKGVVTSLSSWRAADRKQLAPLLPAGWEFTIPLEKAFADVQQQAAVILVTGSFYLVGAVRHLLGK